MLFYPFKLSAWTLVQKGWMLTLLGRQFDASSRPSENLVALYADHVGSIDVLVSLLSFVRSLFSLAELCVFSTSSVKNVQQVS